jgi:hypothetical protein
MMERIRLKKRVTQVPEVCGPRKKPDVLMDIKLYVTVNARRVVMHYTVFIFTPSIHSYKQ